MKTIQLSYNAYIMAFKFDKTILAKPVQLEYRLFGIRAEFPSHYTPITMQGLTIHHEFISAN